MTRSITRKTAAEGFTLVELLVVIAIIAIIAGLVVPNLMSAKVRALVLQDQNNLRGIYNQALVYAQKKKFFPLGRDEEPRAHDSLNLFLSSPYGKGLKPDVFISPVQNEIAAQADADGKFVLDEESLSYAWTTKRMREGSNGVLACNKYVKTAENAADDTGGYESAMVMVDGGGKAQELVIDDENREAYKFTDDNLPEGVGR